MGVGGTAATGDAAGAGTVGGLLSCRSGAGRAGALGRNGGGADTEEAVLRGLRWLARHQEPNGSWRPGTFRCRCDVNAPCDDRTAALADDNADTIQYGISCLALLAFTGAGHTHVGDGEFADNVRRATAYVLANRDEETGTLRAGDGLSYSGAFDHALGTLAMVDLRIMSGDASLETIVAAAVRRLETGQRRGGGWDYTLAPHDRPGRPGGSSETHVTTWATIALRRAYEAGYLIREETWLRARTHLDVVFAENGGVRYGSSATAPSRVNPAWSGSGLVGAYVLRVDSDEPRVQSARSDLLRFLPTRPAENQRTAYAGAQSEYMWYLGTMAMLQLGGEPWERWNTAMKTAVLSGQSRGGCADGSWLPISGTPSGFTDRVYITALSVLTLELYYFDDFRPENRHQPVGRASLVVPRPMVTASGQTDPSFAPSALRNDVAPNIPGLTVAQAKELAQTATTTGDRVTAIKLIHRAGTRADRSEAARAILKSGDALAAMKVLPWVKSDPSPEWVDPLQAAYRMDAYAGIRAALVEAIGVLGKEGVRAVPFLYSRPLTDEDDRVRSAAVRALRSVTGETFGADAEQWRSWYKAKFPPKRRGG
jgi:hypothetical protein